METATDDVLIDLRNVIKTYETGAGDVTVLKEITLQAQDGEFVAVVGPSGSGKSTLLVVTHDRTLSARAERVLHLLDGCVYRDQNVEGGGH